MASEIIVEFPSPLTDKEKKMIYGYKGEVVRCRDCVNSSVIPKEMRNCGERYCEVWCAEMNEDDYCSCGKRKENER